MLDDSALYRKGWLLAKTFSSMSDMLSPEPLQLGLVDAVVHSFTRYHRRIWVAFMFVCIHPSFLLVVCVFLIVRFVVLWRTQAFDNGLSPGHVSYTYHT